MLQAARRAAPGLLARAGGAPARLASAGAPQRPPEEEDDSFELLPPGCSLKDPTYGRSFGAGGRNRRAGARGRGGADRRPAAALAIGHPAAAAALPSRPRRPPRPPRPPRTRCSLSDPVLVYDQKPVEEYRPLRKQAAAGVPQPPLNVAAAQAQLKQSADKKKAEKAAAAGKPAEDDDDL